MRFYIGVTEILTVVVVETYEVVDVGVVVIVVGVTVGVVVTTVLDGVVVTVVGGVVGGLTLEVIVVGTVVVVG